MNSADAPPVDPAMIDVLFNGVSVFRYGRVNGQRQGMTKHDLLELIQVREALLLALDQVEFPLGIRTARLPIKFVFEDQPGDR